MMKPFIAFAFVLIATTSAFAQNSQGGLTYSQDARTQASEEDVRAARRAYRAECQLHQSIGYCECMTGGMAQALTPADLRTATALLAHDLSNARMPSGLNRSSIAAARAAAATFEPSCRTYRR